MSLKKQIQPNLIQRNPIIMSYSEYEDYVNDKLLRTLPNGKPSFIFRTVDPSLQWSIPTRILAFDYDHTLVSPTDDSVFSKSLQDWKWICPTAVPTIQTELKHYPDETHHVYIVSNQQNRVFKEEQILNVATQLQKALVPLNVPVMVLVLFDKTIKKPNPVCMECGLKEYVFQNNQALYESVMSRSLYIGDAMGRPGDWSDSDLQYARALGMSPKTPEEFFPGKPNTLPTLEHTPESLLDVIGNDVSSVYVFVGFPGSGKTTLATRIKEAYPDKVTVISRDEYRTKPQFLRAVSQAEPSSILLIDATHPTQKSRQEVIQRVTCDRIHIIHIDVTYSVAKERNASREHPVPGIALGMFRTRFEKPTVNERVQNVYRIQNN